MKTPDEIKKGLEQCSKAQTCENCIYLDDCVEGFRNVSLTKDALAYIQQLETMLSSAVDALGEAERERDAVLQALHDVCSFCKGHCLEISGGYNLPECERCMLKNYRPENTKEDKPHDP